MTLRQSIEQLIGGPIELEKPIGPIPCHETSDAQRLCCNPLVSVHMVTFNHEHYIREAIESVVMQETDFEYELVIGEDCSTDQTRQICFELLKKYPEKIRVLWSNENLYKNWGNYQRVYDHCRGEYIAYCEGDDYWTDPKKLQKQVDMIRKCGAGLCVANHQEQISDLCHSVIYRPIAQGASRADVFCHYFHTSTYVAGRKALELVWRKYPKIYPWYDYSLVCCLTAHTPFCMIEDVVSVYRKTGSGIYTSLSVAKRVTLSIRQLAQLYYDGPDDDRFCNAMGICGQIVGMFSIARDDNSLEYVGRRLNLLTGIFCRLFLRYVWHVRAWILCLKFARHLGVYSLRVHRLKWIRT